MTKYKIFFVFNTFIFSALTLSVSNSLVDYSKNVSAEQRSSDRDSCDSLRSDLTGLQSEVRAVASLASHCADAKEAVRRCENDHTVLNWIKDTVTELRRELGEIEIKTASLGPGVSHQVIEELQERMNRELKQLRHELQELKVQEISLEAQRDEDTFQVHNDEKSSSEQIHVLYQPKADGSNRLKKVNELDKEVDNIRWFLHQIYEEQEKLRKENQKLKRALHRLIIKDRKRNKNTEKNENNILEDPPKRHLDRVTELIVQRTNGISDQSELDNAKELVRSLFEELKDDIQQRQDHLIKTLNQKLH